MKIRFLIWIFIICYLSALKGELNMNDEILKKIILNEVKSVDTNNVVIPQLSIDQIDRLMKILPREVVILNSETDEKFYIRLRIRATSFVSSNAPNDIDHTYICERVSGSTKSFSSVLYYLLNDGRIIRESFIQE